MPATPATRLLVTGRFIPQNFLVPWNFLVGSLLASRRLWLAIGCRCRSDGRLFRRRLFWSSVGVRRDRQHVAHVSTGHATIKRARKATSSSGPSLASRQERTRMADMVRMMVLLILLVAFFIGYPLLHENTASSCGALAFRAIDRAGPPGDTSSPAANALLARLVDGPGTMEYARRRVRYLPAFLTCTALYWQTVVDPSSAAKVWADLGGDALRGGSTPSVGNARQPSPTPPPAEVSPPPSPSVVSVPRQGAPSPAGMDRSFNQPQGNTNKLFDRPQGDDCRNQLDQGGSRC